MKTVEELKMENLRKGGLKTAQNREHMREIGRKGGLKVSSNRTHMSLIGRIGGKVVQERIKQKKVIV